MKESTHVTFKIIRAVAVTAATIAVLALFVAAPTTATQDKVYVCHAAGQAGTTHFVTLHVPATESGFPQGHFTENGTQEAGHEADYLGPCDPEPTPTATPEVTPSPTPTATICPDCVPATQNPPTPTPSLPSSTPSSTPTATPSTPSGTSTPAPTAPPIETPSPTVTPDLPQTDMETPARGGLGFLIAGFVLTFIGTAAWVLQKRR